MLDRTDVDARPNRGRSTDLGRLFRYALASVGPVGVAGSQFVLSLQLLHTLSAAAFGSFAFLMVTSQFSTGLWSALFCAPLPILLSEGDQDHRQAMLRCLFSTNLILASVAFFAFLGLAASLDVPALAAALFAGYGAVALMRWFARAHAYTSGTPVRTTASDLVYCASLMAGVAVVLTSTPGSLIPPYAALFASAVLGLLPFGPNYLIPQFLGFSLRDLPRYREVWRRHSSWSLIGVVTTEATGNAHAYLVTSFVGPAAFAPVAAAALIIRPIGVVTNALIDFERPQMARQIGTGRISAALRSVRMFRLVLISAWMATAIGVAVVMRYTPTLMFGDRYSPSYLAVGAALWMAVAAARLLRTPESVLLQAAGVFRWLAYASIISSGVSVAAVVVLLVTGGPLSSVGGVLIGEAVFAFWIWRQVRRWRAATSRMTQTAAAEGASTGGSTRFKAGLIPEEVRP